MENEEAGTVGSGSSFGWPTIGYLVLANTTSFFVIRWALGDLKLPFQFRSGKGHSLVTRVSPYLGEEVLVAQMMEHQLGARCARTFPLGLLSTPTSSSRRC